MKKSRIFLLLGLVLLALAGILWITSRPTGPTYKGKRLSQWLKILEQAHGDGSEAEAREAIRQLGTNALPHLVTLLSAHGTERTAAENRGVAYRAISVLGATAAPAIPQISLLLTNPETATEAVAALGEIGPAALPTLIAALTNRNTRARAQIPHLLGSVSSDKSASASALLGCLSDVDLDVRCAAIRALGALRAEPETVVPAILPILSDADPRLRRYAADALSRIRSRPEIVVPALLSHLADNDWLARKSTMQALAAFGKEAEQAAPALLAKLGEPSDFSELFFASLALKRIAPQTALEASARNLQNFNIPSRQLAALTLGGFGWRASNHVSALQQLKARDPSGRVREAAADALEQIEKSRQTRERLSRFQLQEDGVIRGGTDLRRISFVFTGHAYAEGGETILNELAKHRAKASFFLTGEFLTNPNFTTLVQRMVRDGHYLGPHSDHHLLYCSWDEPKRTLVSSEEFTSDLLANLASLQRIGISREKIPYFLPPFEHYNEEIVAWTEESGMTLVNYTPGTRSNADYTGEADKNFVSSQAIFDSILKKERDDPHGLNGFILLLHLGSGPGRKDKFHARFGELLDALTTKGYQFVRVDELLEPKLASDAPNQRSSP